MTKQDIFLANPVALISKNLAVSFYNSATNALSTSVSINGISYDVVGIFSKDGDGNDVIIPKIVYETGYISNTGNQLKLTFNRGENVSKQTHAIVQLLNKQGSHHLQGSYDYVDMGSLLKGIGTAIKGLTYFISAIAGISLFIAGIGVMNMMYISVSERTQEIGIRLAIGATPRNVMYQFLLESILLTGMGGLVLFALGVGGAWVISLFLPFRAIVDMGTFLLAFSVSTIVGIIFGLLPAKQASKKNLIDILR
ncbi:FtsX-like permease family protein [Terrilactibacillus sp. S3-3]|nr:FtsX-like permease family protein [Terrilactibacillus sp. S3-3]